MLNYAVLTTWLATVFVVWGCQANTEIIHFTPADILQEQHVVHWDAILQAPFSQHPSDILPFLKHRTFLLYNIDKSMRYTLRLSYLATVRVLFLFAQHKTTVGVGVLLASNRFFHSPG